MSALDLSGFEDRIRGREVNSDQTVDSYLTWIERFEAWKPAGQPDEAMLIDFDEMLSDPEQPTYPWENPKGSPAPTEYAFTTRIKALSAVKLWSKHEWGVGIDSEVQNIAEGEPDDSFEPTIIDPEEITQTIAEAEFACDNPDCQAAIQIGYDAIMRGSEVVEVRREDADINDGTLYVRAKKGSEPTTISLGPEASAALRDHINEHPERDLLFTNGDGNELTAGTWNKHFLRKHHEAGFHSFARHSAITNRLRAGESFGDVFLRARHQSPQTTLKYVGLVENASAPTWLRQ